MRLRQAANDVLRNDVMLRINEVALRANGELQFCCTLTKRPCKSRAFRVFRKKLRLSPLHPFSDLMDLILLLYEDALKNRVFVI